MDETRTPEKSPSLRVLFWGTYDLSKPRNRILRDGLRQNGARVDECHASVWEDVRDKGVLPGWRQAGRLATALLAYPRLILCFLRAQKPDVVLVGYLGQLDVLLLWPFARLRRVPVVWDQFLSLYNTVVEDRKRLSNRHPLSRALFAWEWLACRAVDRVLMDTRAHAEYVRRLYGLEPERVDVCLGIFGATEKAALVIPNKVFQVLSARRPLITRDSPAIRELLGEGEPGVTLIPPADPAELAAAIRRVVAARHQGPAAPSAGLRAKIGTRAVGEQALAVLRSVAAARQPADSSTT